VRFPVYTEGLSVQAITGTHVVLFGFDVPEANVNELLGFAIRKTSLQAAKPKAKYLDNFLLFEVNDTGEQPNHSSWLNPFQEFVWGDYTLSPGSKYIYEVSARYGTPVKLRAGPRVTLEVETEPDSDGTHAVFFNRGVAGSQAYVRRFTPKGKRVPPPPDEIGAPAYEWLSRGLAEGMRAFIEQASGPGFGIRAAVYEFDYLPMLAEFAAATERGVDVQIVFDDVDNSSKKRPIPDPKDRNEQAIQKAGLEHCLPRTKTTIAHNKFILLLQNGTPLSVWTGSTNLTEGGLYGHWNVGHAVTDQTVAKHYLAYWNTLSADPASTPLRKFDEEQTPLPAKPPATTLPGKPPPGISVVLSPRRGYQALNWYGALMDEAADSVFLTAAFGVSKELSAIFEHPKPYLRYLLLEKDDGKVTTISRNPSNVVAAGGYLGPKNSRYANWLQEVLTGLNRRVQYLHTKFMLIDPLSEDPIIISGSANFSEPSTNQNDENMLLIRGNKRLAEIYLTEFMRVFTHFQFRGKTQTSKHQPHPAPDITRPANAKKLYLQDTDRWARRFYIKDAPRSKERLLFRAAPPPG
jgi:phosphatidylserine/phosphatidylglycerophosphate/cardiolipin synthase-like enzyme